MKLITNREPSYSKSRTRQTIDFCKISVGAKVLDIAAPNELSKQLAKELKVEVVNTVSDLDNLVTPIKRLSFDYVTNFEVLEHIWNPRLFLDNIYAATKQNITMYLSTPSRPRWAWNEEEHVTEYDRRRLDYLFGLTGWKVVREKKIYVRRNPFGIRPLIRNFIPQTAIYELEKA